MIFFIRTFFLTSATDCNGIADEIVKSDFLGETVEKTDNKSRRNRMDFKYGFKWDASEPADISLKPGVPLDKNGNPISYGQ